MSQNSGKRVAITGAASGLGRSLALHYARQGWNVAVADINDLRGQETQQVLLALGIDAFYMHVDVRDDASLSKWKDAIVKRWGGLDVIINNAGVAAHGAIDESPTEDWDWIIDINLMGVVRGCRIFTSVFKKQGFGHVVNVASIAGLIHSPEMNSYNVTKAGVVALSDTMKSELKRFGIKVSVVCPGFFPTNLMENTRSPNPHIKTAIGKLFAKSKLNADDVARIVFNGVKAGRFYILPHKDFAAFWYLKRVSPAAYFYAMARMVSKRPEFKDKARAAS
ncbi:MAG TPA: SDR family oxidoreductase [Oligoflexus sp.]|uniref:SDR family oxidoreductase n=1 Tax=Oligoflexus sp. TaxID=1971216 RepID=UPI002D3FCF25|nr:SDR family oxidoreductase [Oligoflexus sp.]HYX38038.1 SDR family oxidoreductase [Oligoflexus sp.]